MDDVKTVILCGGKGTRSYPFTEYFPKVMMPINGTPILIHLMRIYANQGFKSFVLSAGYRKEILTDYFEGRALDWEVQIVDTGADADTGERIERCAHLLGQTFFATYGDGLGNLDLHLQLACHHSLGGLATLTTVPLVSQYGLVVLSHDAAVSRFEEKPAISGCWINAGFFAFEKEVFHHWKGSNLESQVLPHLADKGFLYAYKHEGFWKSMDTSKDQEALEKLYLDGGAPWTQLPPRRRVDEADQAASARGGR